MDNPVLLWIVTATSCLVLSGCGGGGGDNVAPTTGPVGNPADFETVEYNQNYALGVMNASSAYANGGTGNGVLIAVVDTGVLSDHVDLVGQIDGKSIDIVNPGLPLTDADGHGTSVTGVIAGVKNDSGIHGIAFNSKILAIRAVERSPGNPVVDDCGNVNGCTFTQFSLAAAVNYAVDNNARIINLSLSGGKTISSDLNTALTRAVQAGVVIVASAGNEYQLIDHDSNPATPDIPDPNGLTPDAPANFAGTAAALGRALAVGATDQNNLIASFSNRAGSGNVRNFYLVAPGVDIITPGLDTSDPASRDTFFRATGTSFSSPYVAGAIALLIDQFPNLQPQQAVALLVDTATDLGFSGVDDTYGAGIVNLARAFSPAGATSIRFKGQAVPVDLSSMFETPKGAFGDWAEKGGAFSNIIFQDKYQRNFKTDNTANKIGASARVDDLLRSYTDRNNSTYLSEQLDLNVFGEEGFAQVSLTQKMLGKRAPGTIGISIPTGKI